MAIRGFHAHIYFDADEIEQAKAPAAAARETFGAAVRQSENLAMSAFD